MGTRSFISVVAYKYPVVKNVYFLKLALPVIWKQICCLFHDDRTRLRNGESIKDWEEVQQKHREIGAEKQKENYVGLQSEHEVSGKVYHVTNYLDRSKEATAFDKIDKLIDRNR